MAVVFLTPPKKTHLPVATCENDHWSHQVLYATCLTQSVTDPTINRIESESITPSCLESLKNLHQSVVYNKSRIVSICVHILDMSSAMLYQECVWML